MRLFYLRRCFRSGKLCMAAIIFIFGSITPPAMYAQTSAGTGNTITVSMQKRIKGDAAVDNYAIVNEIQQWDPKQTAIIICDMWDKHWCKGATARVAEMAPKLNEVLTIARSKGVLIVHAPSDCIGYYKNHPARKTVLKYYDKKYDKLIDNSNVPGEKGATWPIDQSDEGCDDMIQCTQGKAWTKQIDAIKIEDSDAISDSGSEIASLFEKKGIKNVILSGVHTNMCVIGRTFGLRSMVRLGKNVVLMRDMTDAMYNSRRAPYVNHFTGVRLVVDYIEQYVCPTILSTDFTGKKQLRFKDDKRPVVAFITAEGEYHANQTLPRFAHELMLHEGVNCEFAIGKPAMDGPGRHNLENLQVLQDASLAVFFVRRVALEPQKMDMIKNYIKSGKPVLGIRTASHSFDAKGNVAREGGGITQSSENVSGFLAQWPEFDEEILGGNYKGHYGHLEEKTKIAIVPGMEKHPLLKGVGPNGFGSVSWLYQNRPLRSAAVQVLLTGTIPNEPSEPVLWVNRTKYNNKVVYTSLGHWEDWNIPDFQQVLVNSIHYLLNDTGKNK